MKRFHVHVSVGELEPSIAFYSKLFAIEPTVVKPGYAKWMLEDPRINFAISAGRSRTGIEHLGVQVDSAEELGELERRMQAADPRSVAEPGANCCYAHSDKHWAVDPQGVAWEGFHTLGEARLYGTDRGPAMVAGAAATPTVACCGG